MRRRSLHEIGAEIGGRDAALPPVVRAINREKLRETWNHFPWSETGMDPLNEVRIYLTDFGRQCLRQDHPLDLASLINQTAKAIVALFHAPAPAAPQRERPTQGGRNAECPVCGGAKVVIRGRSPGHTPRVVCPTCLIETLEAIRARIDRTL